MTSEASHRHYTNGSNSSRKKGGECGDGGDGGENANSDDASISLQEYIIGGGEVFIFHV